MIFDINEKKNQIVDLAFLACVSTQVARLVFYFEKLIFEKFLESPLTILWTPHFSHAFPLEW